MSGKNESFVAALLASHSALGLTFAALVYAVCFSGTLAVFAEELLRWERPGGPVVTAVPAATLHRALAAGAARAASLGALDELIVHAPTAALPRLTVELTTARNQERWIADGSGALVEPIGAPWQELLIRLHYYALLPGVWGFLVVGGTGVFTVALILSGLLAHPRIFRDAFRLRLGGSRRLQEADLHNRFGVWGLPFHFVIAFSGASIALAPATVRWVVEAAYGADTDAGFAALYGPGPTDERAPAPLPDLGAILADVLARHADAAVEMVVVQRPETSGQLVHVTANRPTQLALAERHYYGGDGVLLRTAGYDDGPAGIQWIGALSALHYGRFGGLLLKLAYGVLGVSLLWVTLTGVTIWLARWNDRGGPRPAWARAWTAMVWSQPLALGGAALCDLAVGFDRLLAPYLLGMGATFAAALVVPDQPALSRALRLATAALWLAVAGAHAVVWRERMQDEMGWIVDALIVALAVLTAGGAHPATWRWLRPAARTP